MTIWTIETASQAVTYCVVEAGLDQPAANALVRAIWTGMAKPENLPAATTLHGREARAALVLRLGGMVTADTADRALAAHRTLRS